MRLVSTFKNGFALVLSVAVLSGSVPQSSGVARASATNLGYYPWGSYITSTLSPVARTIQRRLAKHSHVPQVFALPKTTTTIAQTTQHSAPVVEKPTYLAVVDQPDIKEVHKKIADNVLRTLPTNCVTQLENFYVRYDNPESRGLGSKTTIILDGSVPDDEFRALLIHELGHVMDLGCLAGSGLSGVSEFMDGSTAVMKDDPSLGFYRISWNDEETKKQSAKDADFVSGYASWDPYEDLAESITYFVLQNDVFLERARSNEALAQKYQWIASTIFPAESMTLATGKSIFAGTPPWDTTKLPYIWER